MPELFSVGLRALTILIFLPVVGALIVWLLGDRVGPVRIVALLVALVELGLAIAMLAGFQPIVGFQFAERTPWIPALGLEYHLGVDGVSVLMVALTTFLTVIAILASWEAMDDRPRHWAGLILLLEAGVIGAFVSLDAILFFIFWEAMLIPMYLLIGTLGGPRRIYAAIKFFIYTAVGSLVMLAGILAVRFLAAGSGAGSFDILELLRAPVPDEWQVGLFLTFALAFAIKVPIFPFHTWLPDAYTQTPVTVLILGTMLVKVGAYGFIRFCLPLFPNAMRDLAPLFATLAVIGIVYGALLAVAQRDIVRLLAYSSISHLGFVVLGIFALNLSGLSGATIQMVNHGIYAGGLFAIAAMIYRRSLTTDIEGLGGMARRWPILTAFFTVLMFAALGLPGLNGFVGEFLILLGAFETRQVWAIVATAGIVLAAIYFLWLFQRAMHGPLREDVGAATPDLTPREILVLLPIVVMVVWLGLFPATFLGRVQPSLDALLSQGGYQSAAAQSAAPSPGDQARVGEP